MPKTKTKMQHSIKQIKRKKFSLKAFNKILFVLTVILGVYYLMCINDLSVKSFKIQELKGEISDLNNENNNFEVKTMSLSSYNNLSQRVEKLSMIAINEVDYIVSSVAVVAVQK